MEWHKYSLIQVSGHYEATCCGTWIQNHVGTIESAKEKALGHKLVNGSRPIVAVVDEVSNPGIGSQCHYLTPLAIV